MTIVQLFVTIFYNSLVPTLCFYYIFSFLSLLILTNKKREKWSCQ